MTTTTDLSDRARRALEDVCSGQQLEQLADLYSADFVDHVNDRTYRGHEGARRSIAIYLALFDDLRFTVEQQVTEGDQVASRWRLNGSHRRRDVELRGVVISTFDDAGRIVEDRAISDSVSLLRQLGVWRSLAMFVRHRDLMRPQP